MVQLGTKNKFGDVFFMIGEPLGGAKTIQGERCSPSGEGGGGPGEPRKPDQRSTAGQLASPKGNPDKNYHYLFDTLRHHPETGWGGGLRSLREDRRTPVWG